MNNFIEFLRALSSFDNPIIFALSIIPYSIFLFYLYKLKDINKTVKIGFSLTVLFVVMTIIFSILSKQIFQKTLIEVDAFHGIAESFLTLSDFVILLGFVNQLTRKEVKNS